MFNHVLQKTQILLLSIWLPPTPSNEWLPIGEGWSYETGDISDC